jgi:sterol desaturase/sphingolipid hydroxylase (fatty acid hydroxylase superfamily)
MTAIEAFIRTHHHFINLLLRYQLLLLLARFLFFTPLELMWPAREVPYLRAIGRDLVAFVVVSYAMIPMAAYLHQLVPGKYHFPVPATIAHLPLGVRVLLFFILGDLGHYWTHRLTHTRYLWRIHRWHHSPTYLCWLAGVRSTGLDLAIIGVPFLLISPLLGLSPWWAAAVINVAYLLINDWMHLNVPWGLKWVEWIVVTPRYHHIHHSDNPEHFVKNLAPIFPVWDRLFGTYFDPDKVGANLSFGTGEKTNPVRLLVGI